ncbi:uncharacterized protein LOC118194032 isoform X1 [Stegodyphus dumicola]|uniref:uncharacterized protein LOC118194032 isoform X1 n=1 Tax=Stegodyphus dumicola TaxID=202533 RepID=UPI0015AE9B33|nr:uncharacterized protein LOC118194032 isoform X1 [Stegodyphus dumicola]
MESYLVNYITMLCVLLHSLGCLAIAEIDKFDNDDARLRRLLKVSRRLLYTSDEHYTHTSGPHYEYMILGCVIVGILALIRCCIKYGCEDTEDDLSDATIHPPPITHLPSPPRSVSNASVLAPPATSRGIILHPDSNVSINFPNVINVEFDDLRNIPNATVGENKAATNLQDLPPDYYTVVNSSTHFSPVKDTKSQEEANKIKSYEPPPKY